MANPPAVTDEECRDALAAFDRQATHAAFNTGRYRMRYVVWGGPSPAVPLVIVPGLADAARGFAMVMHRLAPRFTCVAYELPNGLDDGARLGTYRHRHFADDLFALLDHLELDRVALVGSSFGAPIALRALAAAPHRFAKCVLQGGFARRPLKWYERLGARQARYWGGRLRQLPFRVTAMRLTDPTPWEACPPLARELLLWCSGQMPTAAAARRAVMLDKLDLRPLLPTIRTPILLIGGDRDGIVPRVYEAELEAGLPDVRRAEFADCGHYPQYTHPAEMAAAVAEFVK